MRSHTPILLATALWLTASCSSDKDHNDADADADREAGSSPDADREADSSPDADREADSHPDATDADTDGAAPSIFDTGAVHLDECRSMNRRCVGPHSSDPLCGTCQYRAQYRADQCTAANPCDDMFLYWAAVDCTTDGLTGMTRRLLDAYPRMIQLCVQPIYPGEILPTSLGAPEREIHVMSHIWQRLRPGGDLAAWSGANLLMGGCSMGATRYPVVAARYDADSQWVGTAKNAVCMSDGVVDLVSQERFIGEGEGPSCTGRHGRIAGAYTVADPTAEHSCEASPQGQCACDSNHASLPYPGDCAEGDCVAFDSIVTERDGTFDWSAGVSADSFAITRWRLFTEGGSWADVAEQRCENDVVADPPFAGFCALLDRDDNHSCVLESFPAHPHCAYYTRHVDELCVDWFLSL